MEGGTESLNLRVSLRLANSFSIRLHKGGACSCSWSNWTENVLIASFPEKDLSLGCRRISRAICRHSLPKRMDEDRCCWHKDSTCKYEETEFSRETKREKRPRMMGNQGLKDGEFINSSREAWDACAEPQIREMKIVGTLKKAHCLDRRRWYDRCMTSRDAHRSAML